MAAPARPRMTADEFLDWAITQPDGGRYELVAGEVVAMAPERRQPRPRQGRGVRCPARRCGRGRPLLRSVHRRHGRAHRRGHGLRARRAAALRPAGGGRVRRDRRSLDRGRGPRRRRAGSRTPAASSTTISGCPRSAIISSSRPPTARSFIIAATMLASCRSRILRVGTLELQPPGLTVDVASLCPSPA